MLIQLYKKLLNQSNIIYIVIEVRKPRFEKLDFLVSPIIDILAILKIIIFVNNIKITGNIAIYL